MKKITIVFLVLLLCFCGIWVIKFKTPVNRPEDQAADSDSSDYWRNPVDLPEADEDWILDPEIPQNYIPVPGKDELYMVIDDDGKIEKYRQREQQEDGSWLWADVDPNIPEEYIPVDGLENIYKVTNADGSTVYYKYIRNDDDAFAFVQVDENGNEIPPETEDGDNHKIPDNYIRITGNIYAVYNEYNVCVGYKERRQDSDGKYYWVDVEKPKQEDDKPTNPTSPSDPSSPSTPTVTPPSIEVPDITNPPDAPDSTVPDADDDPDTYTQIETITSTEIKGDWRITYKTTITRVYTKEGDLLSTIKDGPHEISREKIADDNGEVPDPSKIAATLQAEYARVSVGLVYNRDLAEEVMAILNADRVAAGLPAMRIETGSSGQLLADVRAADMAIYNHSDYDSPLYGTVTDVCERFDVANKGTAEAVWKATATKTAEDIASRLQILHGEMFETNDYSSVGLSIVRKNGYYYIDFILLK